MAEKSGAQNRVDASLARLETALSALEAAFAETPGAGFGLDAGDEALREERDRLAEEVEALREAAARDAELRAEAAAAVRAALADLRAIVPPEETYTAHHGSGGRADG